MKTKPKNEMAKNIKIITFGTENETKFHSSYTCSHSTVLGMD